MKKKNYTFFIAAMCLTMSLASCEFFENIGISANSDFSYSFNESESIDSNANYYKGKISDTHYSINKHSVYQKNTPFPVGDMKILVIPVVIKGYEKNASSKTKDRIEKTFFGDSSDTAWESVASYYYKSSYGKLKISGTVTDWFECGLTPKQVYEKNNADYGDLGTYYILNQAYQFAKNQGIDMTEYDLDKDGYVDSIWLVYSCPDSVAIQGVSDKDNPFWAFTFWDYTNVNKKNKNNPVPNTYAWASYSFMNNMNDLMVTKNDAHTFIHETGHILGLDDYYDTTNIHHPLGCLDMMDYNVGDHCAFSKYSLGWTSPYVVTGETTIELAPFESSGQCILIKNPNKKFNESAFDEYLMLELLTPTGLWKQDATEKYQNQFLTYTKPGVRITHVDARLIKYNTKTFVSSSSDGNVDLAYSNTPSRSYSEGTETLRDDLIAIIPKNRNTDFQTTNYVYATNESLFTTGDSFSFDEYNQFFRNKKFHDGSSFPYFISFENVSNSGATITFTIL